MVNAELDAKQSSSSAPMFARWLTAVLAAIVVTAAVGIWLEPLTFDSALWLVYRVTDDGETVNRLGLATKAALMALLPASVSAVTLLFLNARHQKQFGLTRCGRCGYILKGLSEPRCPECGNQL